MKILTDKDLPNSISEFTIEDVKLLLEAVATAGQYPRFMDDAEASFRLGWIMGTLSREITMKEQAKANEQLE